MSTLLYGRPPVVFDPPSTGAGAAIQVSPLIPGSTALEAVSEGSVDEIMIYAPPGVLERRHMLALALRALKVGGRLDVMALKDKGGSRLKKELTGFGVEVGGGLVEKQYLRLQEQSPHESDNLALAPGKNRRPLTQEFHRLSESREQCSSRAVTSDAPRVDIESQRQLEVLLHGAGNENRLLLHVHHPRPKPRTVLVEHGMPAMVNPSLVGTIEAA